MSIFQGEISWNEVKEIVEDFTNLSVVGDGDVVYLNAQEMSAISVTDGTEVYFGTVCVNDMESTDLVLKLSDSASTVNATINIVSSAAVPYQVPFVMWNIFHTGGSTLGSINFIGYKITLA